MSHLRLGGFPPNYTVNDRFGTAAMPSVAAPYGYRSDPLVPAFPDDRPIIVFDGNCSFCSRWVQFALKHDRRAQFRFLPAQSPLGGALYRHYGLFTNDYDTSILLADGRAYIKADGAIRIMGRLGLPWSLAVVLQLVPSAWLDAAYDFIARNRRR